MEHWFLFFIDKYYKDYNVVRISISRLSFIEHYNFGKCISKIADEINRKVVVIASGDLSHMLKEEGPYGFTEEGPYGVGYYVASFDVIGIDENRHFDQYYNKIEEERLSLIMEKAMHTLNRWFAFVK
jgi:AmmeMemoRadiSam system protein B